MLIFVKLFDVQQCVLIRWIQPDDLVERFEGAIDEPAPLEIEAEAEQNVRLLETGQARALQQTLVNIDGARDLPLFAVEASEQQMDFQGVAEALGRLGELADGEVDLIGHEEIEPDDVMERLRHAAAIDQSPRAQLVALPGFPDRQPDEQRDQRGEKWIVGAHNSSVRCSMMSSARSVVADVRVIYVKRNMGFDPICRARSRRAGSGGGAAVRGDRAPAHSARRFSPAAGRRALR